MSLELLYTSVPRGLVPTAQGFCTVARTEPMAAGLVQRLEALSSYRHVFAPQSADAPRNPVNYRHLTSRLAGRHYHILSRVAAYGVDYSHRTNFIAHHVALEPHQLSRCTAGPAALASAPGFLESQWEADRRPTTSPAGSRQLPAIVSEARLPQVWQTLTGDAGWAGALAATAQPASSQNATLIFAPGMDVLPLLVEALALLPATQRWSVTFSTYFTGLPPGTECKWRCVTTGSEEAIAAQRDNRQLIIDLTAPTLATPSLAVEAARQGQPIPVQADRPIALTPAPTPLAPHTPSLDTSRPTLPGAAPAVNPERPQLTTGPGTTAPSLPQRGNRPTLPPPGPQQPTVPTVTSHNHQAAHAGRLPKGVLPLAACLLLIVIGAGAYIGWQVTKPKVADKSTTSQPDADNTKNNKPAGASSTKPEPQPNEQEPRAKESNEEAKPEPPSPEPPPTESKSPPPQSPEPPPTESKSPPPQSPDPPPTEKPQSQVPTFLFPATSVSARKAGVSPAGVQSFTIADIAKGEVKQVRLLGGSVLVKGTYELKEQERLITLPEPKEQKEGKDHKPRQYHEFFHELWLTKHYRGQDKLETVAKIDGTNNKTEDEHRQYKVKNGIERSFQFTWKDLSFERLEARTATERRKIANHRIKVEDDLKRLRYLQLEVQPKSGQPIRIPFCPPHKAKSLTFATSGTGRPLVDHYVAILPTKQITHTYEIVMPELSQDEWKVSAESPKLPITVEINHAKNVTERAVFQITYRKLRGDDKKQRGEEALDTKGLQFSSPTLVKKCASLAKAQKVGKAKNKNPTVGNSWAALDDTTNALISATKSDSDASATAKVALTAAQLQQINTISRTYATIIKNFRPPATDDAEIKKFVELHHDLHQYLQKSELFKLLHAFEKNPRLDTRFELRLHLQDKKKKDQQTKPDPYHIVLVSSVE